MSSLIEDLLRSIKKTHPRPSSSPAIVKKRRKDTCLYAHLENPGDFYVCMNIFWVQTIEAKADLIRTLYGDKQWNENTLKEWIGSNMMKIRQTQYLRLRLVEEFYVSTRQLPQKRKIWNWDTLHEWFRGHDAENDENEDEKNIAAPIDQQDIVKYFGSFLAESHFSAASLEPLDLQELKTAIKKILTAAGGDFKSHFPCKVVEFLQMDKALLELAFANETTIFLKARHKKHGMRGIKITTKSVKDEIQKNELAVSGAVAKIYGETLVEFGPISIIEAELMSTDMNTVMKELQHAKMGMRAKQEIGLELLFKVLCRLHELKQQGIFHRDLKPLNIGLMFFGTERVVLHDGENKSKYFTPEYAVKLLDIADAKVMSHNEAMNNIPTKQSWPGSAYYMPQVQVVTLAKGNARVYHPPAVDLFTMGISMMEFILGDDKDRDVIAVKRILEKSTSPQQRLPHLKAKNFDDDTAGVIERLARTSGYALDLNSFILDPIFFRSGSAQRYLDAMEFLHQKQDLIGNNTYQLVRAIAWGKKLELENFRLKKTSALTTDV